MTTLREDYAKVAEDLQKDWGKSNRLEIPRLDKIVINVGMGRAQGDDNYKQAVLDSLAQITGQRPVVTKARKSIAGFKLRDGMEIGAKATLRGRRMDDFFTRLVHVVLPRVRDFRGLSKKGFDGHGNYSVGITEHTVFPEISYEDVTATHPLQAVIVTTAKTDDEAYRVLKGLGFPFQEEEPRGA